MEDRDTGRAAFFPAIEKKHGKPMSYWHRLMGRIKDMKYADQMAYLMNDHGFSRVHANALVMYSKGSTSARRFESPDEYFESLDPTKGATLRRIFEVLQKAFPQLELVMAWNQPMLKVGKQYVFGASAASHHILIAPWDPEIIEAVRPRLTGLVVNKKTIRIPVDWKVDGKLLRDLVASQLDRKDHR